MRLLVTECIAWAGVNDNLESVLYITFENLKVHESQRKASDWIAINRRSEEKRDFQWWTVRHVFSMLDCICLKEKTNGT